MSRQVTLFCEGESDMALFRSNPFFTGLNFTLLETGGKRGQSVFARGYGASKVMKSAKSKQIILRDRDFDFPLPKVEGLIKIKEGYYAMYRTCIENYLLTPSTLFNYFEQKGTKGIEKLSSSEACKALLIDCAKEVKYYQAVRHALGATRKPNVLNTRWTENKLPVSLQKDDVLEKAKKSIEVYQETASKINIEAFEKNYRNFNQVFNHDSFYDQGLFLVYFSGKELGYVLARELQDRGFSLGDFYRFASENVDLSQIPDMVQLRELLNAQ